MAASAIGVSRFLLPAGLRPKVFPSSRTAKRSRGDTFTSIAPRDAGQRRKCRLVRGKSGGLAREIGGLAVGLAGEKIFWIFLPRGSGKCCAPLAAFTGGELIGAWGVDWATRGSVRAQGICRQPCFIDPHPRGKARPMQCAQSVLPILLAGGQGSRLFELTQRECKPAVPFAGGRRIVDWTVENVLRSGFGRLAVATQYCPSTLEYHLRAVWGRDFAPFGLAMFRGARLPGRSAGFLGTADAVAQILPLASRADDREVLVLSADHIYAMDYRPMIAAHRASGAKVTVAATVADLAQARGFGVIEADAGGAIVGFEEKPDRPVAMPGDAGRALVSMGIYVFDRHWLVDVLARDALDAASGHDFGHDIVPAAVAQGMAQVHVPQGSGAQAFYWRDVGTLDGYRAAALDFAADPLPCALPRVRGPGVDAGFVRGDTVVMPGAWVAPGADLNRTIVAPNTLVPADLVIGRDADEDARWFRVTQGGTRLVTAAMLASRDAHLNIIRTPDPRHFKSRPFQLQRA